MQMVCKFLLQAFGTHLQFVDYGMQISLCVCVFVRAWGVVNV